MLDPLLQLLIAVPLALLFIGSSQHKRVDGRRFTAQLEAYELLPAGTLGPVARLLPWCELVVALALLIPASRAVAGVAAALLLTIYGAAILINVLRGRRAIDCGCGGPAQPLSYWLVLRNTLLASAAMLLVIPAGGRSLGTMDAFAVLLMSIVLALCYVAIGQLLHNRAILGGWKE